MQLNKTEIAVVGMACWYPGAKNLSQFWENILARRKQFRRMIDQRLPMSQYYDADPGAIDKTYGKFAAYIDGFEFDWLQHKIPKKTFDSTDVVHWLALEVADQAIQDALYCRTSLPSNSAVILGNTLTGEWTRAQTLRLRWPYVEKVLRSTVAARLAKIENLDSTLFEIEQCYKSVFPEITEDTLAGGLSNTIAGRIGNHFDVTGGAYTIDGACSSSLLAIANAAQRMNSEKLDLAIVGGVDISLDSFELVGFAKTKALATEQMRVFDEKAEGFIPGEGCGFVVLKPLQKALKDGNKIYSIVKGWGISSDGKGGITAPKASGQALAIKKAYEMAGYSAGSVDFFESHGTGTPLGDRIELIALASQIGDPLDSTRICGITSLKSIIGHTKAAAGIGAFIKTNLAVCQRVLPPTSGCINKNKTFSAEAKSIYPIRWGQSFADSRKMTAGVSAMGFGGINCHVTIESVGQKKKYTLNKLEPSALMVSNDEHEVFVFEARSLMELKGKLETAKSQTEFLTEAELTDYAFDLSRFIDGDFAGARAGIVAASVSELHRNIDRAIELFHKISEQKKTARTKDDCVWVALNLSATRPVPRIGFIFPGQGSQKLNMARTLISRFKEFNKSLCEADILLEQNGLDKIGGFFQLPIDRLSTEAQLKDWDEQFSQAEIASPSICMNSYLWTRFLDNLGISPDVVLGHSLGELTALYAAGALSFEQLILYSAKRGRAMNDPSLPRGAMLSVAADHHEVQKLLAEMSDTSNATLVNLNCPIQTVVAGDLAAIDQLSALCKNRSLSSTRLKVSNAFHTSSMSAASDLLRKEPGLKKSLELTKPAMISSMTGQALDCGLQLNEYLANQVVSPVLFLDSVKEIITKADILIEVGPGRSLTSITRSNLEKTWPDVPVLPIESSANDMKDLKKVMACLFSYGLDIKFKALYRNRLIRKFVPLQDKIFIDNPCERPLKKTVTNYIERSSTPIIEEIRIEPNKKEKNSSVEKLILTILSSHTGFPVEQLDLQHRLLDDLNLDSIKSGNFISEISQTLGVEGRIDPLTKANASLSELIADFASEASCKGKIASQPAAREENPFAISPRIVKLKYDLKLLEDKYLPAADSKSNTNQVLIVDLLSHDKDSAALMADDFVDRGINCRVVSGPTQDLEKVESIFILIDDENKKSLEQNIRDGIEKVNGLLSLLTRLKNLAADSNKCRVSVIYLGDGSLGFSDSHEMGFLQGLQSFLSSVFHEEAGSFLLRYLDISAQFIKNNAFEKILQFHNSQQAMHVIGIDRKGIVRVPRLEESETQTAAPSMDWSKNDVVLVSGGSKGITLECVQALAKKSGVQLALVGRSAQLSSAVSQGLKLRGLRFKYYSCDVVDELQVRKLIANIEFSQGHISAIVHGAGVNFPAVALAKNKCRAWEQLSVKVIGAYNLIQNVNIDNLRCFIGLSSVIGVVGMPGNCWYALANESLDILTRKMSKQHPHIVAKTLAFTAWQDIGMGAQVAVAENLRRKAVKTISVEQGVQYFLEAFYSSSDQIAQVITGQLGSLDLKHITSPPNQPLRFQENVVSFTPGIEAATKVNLNLNRDHYIKDHCFQGSYLFPTVFGLEAMFQVAQLTATGFSQKVKYVEFRDIQLVRPILVTNSGEQISVIVKVLEKNHEKTLYQAEIRCAQTGFKTPHFSAFIDVFSSRPADKKVAELAATKFENCPTQIDVEQNLYGPILFQGQQFQKISAVFHATEKAATLALAADDSGDQYLLGSPFLRDALLQAPQIMVPHSLSLPVKIEKLSVSISDSLPSIVSTKMLSDLPDGWLCSVQRVDQDGRIVEEIKGYQLKTLQQDHVRPNLCELLAASQNRQLQAALSLFDKKFGVQISNTLIVKVSLSQENSNQRRKKITEPLLHYMAQRFQLGNQHFVWDQNGQPREEKGAQKVSVAHDGNMTLATIQTVGCGCDLQTVFSKTQETWRDLLTSPFFKLFASLVTDERMAADTVGTILWTIREALFKKTQETKFASIELVQREGNCFVFCATQLSGQKHKVCSTLLTGSKDETLALSISIDQTKNSTLFEQISRQKIPVEICCNAKGQPLTFVYKTKPVFRDTSNLDNSVYFAKYFEWMGELREFGLFPIAEKLKNDVASGKWGLVTNDTQLELLSNIGLNDLIHSRLTLNREFIGRQKSTVGIDFKWFKQTQAGLTPVAQAKMNATWVEILGHGRVQPAPFPTYLRDQLALLTAVGTGQESQLEAPLARGEFESSKSEAAIFNAPTGPAQQKYLLRKEKFSTSLSESNFIGNVYFGNYSTWAGKVCDQFFYQVNPEMFRPLNSLQPRCVECNINHLRELMPFEQLEVEMYLQRFGERTVDLHFSFYNVKNHDRKKIAFATQKIAWLEDGKNFAKVPAEVSRHLFALTQTSLGGPPILHQQRGQQNHVEEPS